MKTNTSYHSPPLRRTWAGIAGALLASLTLTQAAEEMYHPLALGSGGGVVAAATITSTVITPTNATLCWHGMRGYYAVEMSTNLATWTPVGSAKATEFDWCLTVPNSTGDTNVYYRLNQANAFVGSGGCSGCHGDKFAEYLGTAHATAFASATNFALVCRAVGLGQPTGFTDATNTPHLVNVGCENCHGPAAWHKYSDHSVIRPAVSIDPKICGSCHQGAQQPIYAEYSTSPHAEVLDDIKYGFAGGVYYPDTIVVGANTLYGYYVTTNSDLTLKTNATTGIIRSDYVPGSAVDNGRDRQASCGVCHSAAARLAMLENYEAMLAGRTNVLALPVAKDAADYGAACVTCHDPHSNYNAAQLRNPMRSTNFFTMPTTSDKRTLYTTNFQGGITTNIVYLNTAFSSLYDPQVQVCGQCHNTRGARWDGRGYGLITNGTTVSVGLTTNITGLSRSPHPAAQYNVLIGIIQDDYLGGTNSPVTHNHSRAANGCATCHVPIYASGGTNFTGHTFKLDTRGCQTSGCHGSVPSEFRSTQTGNSNSVNNIVASLVRWATNAGPALFGTNYPKYAENSWEYTTPGLLATVTNGGPSSADQLKIPDGIKQARYNIYEVKGDGSWGIHNLTFISRLLSDASTKVNSALTGLTTTAYFTPSATNGYAPFAVTFTTWGVGITNYSWNFGDGGTSTSANPTYTYASPGTNTVTLTVMTAGGTFTYYRTNCIRTFAQPAISFSANTYLGEAPMAVTFTNTSTSTNNVTAWRWTFNGANVTATTAVTNYTFTTPGYYTVALRATTPVGTLTVTSNSFVVGTTNPAYFVGTATSGYGPLTNTFTCLGAGATSYSWSFGDGGTSTDPNPTYVYNSRGTNTVTLTVTTPGGIKTWTRTNYVAVYDRPAVSFAGGPLTGDAPLTVSFTNTSFNTNSVTAWRWTFNGVNVTATTAVTNYTFSNAGTYDVLLRATTPAGTITVTNSAYISAVTNAAYFVTTNATSAYGPMTNTFVVQGSGATSYSWTFGDGGTSTDPNPTYVYNTPGTYTVSLIVGTAGGPKTYTRTAYINMYQLPVVSFTANTVSGPAPLSVTFTNTSTATNSVTSWRWTFGSQTVTTNAPVFTFVFTNATPANYTVQLRATTGLGTVTTTNINYISVTP